MSTEDQPSTTVLIVGNHDLLNKTLRDLMSLCPDIEIANGILTAKDAVSEISNIKPDLILIDLMIADMESLTPVKQIHQAHPNIPIITMSGFPTDHFVTRISRYGVKRNIKRGESAELIVKAIREVCFKQEASHHDRSHLYCN